jgi:hypothetical protein
LTQVDGVSVDDENDEQTAALTPPTVEVSDDLIVAIGNEPQLIAEQAEEDEYCATIEKLLAEAEKEQPKQRRNVPDW